MPFLRIQDSRINHYISDFYNADIDSCSRYELLSKSASILAKQSVEILKRERIDSAGGECEQNLEFPFKDSIIFPIMRAGLPLFQPFYSLLHSNQVVFLSTKRIPNQKIEIYCSDAIIPERNQSFFLLDSVIGTGGTICAAIEFLLGKGIQEEKICVASVLASDIGIAEIQKKYKDSIVFSGYLDSQLFFDASFYPRKNDIGKLIFGT